MSHVNLLIDGMLSGTGVRDVVNGGYIAPEELGLSTELQEFIAIWLEAYNREFFGQYKNKDRVTLLDEEGVKIARMLRAELDNAEVGYFSDALLEIMEI